MHTLDPAKHVALARTMTARLAAVAQNDANGADNTTARLSELETRVCEGLHAGEFHLVFQGAYRVEGGAPARLEAQLRWTHPEYGLLLPGIFMMPLEHPQVAREMAAFVVDGICRELRDCVAMQLPLQPIAITVPTQIALLDSFADDLARAAQSHGVPLHLFEIEVTDSAEAAKLLSLRTMTEGLREAGVGVALGNWGNGASSLALLGALDVDTITIARELMSAVPRDRRACVVMSAVMDLLCELGVRVVVNGVDTREQFEWLGRWPDVLAQGALLARPQAGLRDVLELKCDL
ncbi:EAL domain-containing protein [Paraburkholderia sp. Ac-20342]|uniref:EAL domain-containing protein n=1 Tax=Paraburkholderia sp. Ac-20342 TaxID=2703889 RepID=UPI001980C5B8|nr:EAL domain-containing protein [Paraburkholderia sp. Ac-20342]MBN3847590.1 EAL domain-containing protein [Paraburkholderia sp. Ac-20342]